MYDTWYPRQFECQMQGVPQSYVKLRNLSQNSLNANEMNSYQCTQK